MTIFIRVGIAVVRPKAHVIIPAALAYSIFSVPHFFFHIAHLGGATVGEAITPLRFYWV